MKFKKLKVQGFGNLHGVEMKFQPHLNVILAPNESGKSTLTECLYRCLYGFHVQKKEKTFLDQYKPLRGDRYAAQLTIEDCAGTSYEVDRDFAAKTVLVRNAITGEDLTGRFPTERKGQHLLFAEDVLGISRDIYRSVCFIAQGFVDSLDNGEELSGEIRRLADSSGQDSDHKMALDRLDKAIDKIGKTERASNKEYGQTCDRVRQLDLQRAGIVESKQEREQIEQQLEQLRERLEQTQRDLTRSRALNLSLQLARLNTTLEKFHSLTEEIEQLENKTEQLEQYKSVPTQLRDELHLDRDRAEKLSEQIAEHEKAIANTEQAIEDLKRKLRTYQNFYKLPEDAVERIDTLGNSWKKEKRELELLDQRISQAKHSRQRIEQQLAELNTKVEKFSAVLQGDLGATNAQLNRLIEDVSKQAAKKHEINFREQQLQARRIDLARKKKSFLILSASVGFLAAAGTFFFQMSETLPGAVVSGLIAGGVTFALIFFATGQILSGDKKNIIEEQKALDVLEDEVQNAEQRKQDALTSADVPSMKDLNELLNLRKDLQGRLSDDDSLKQLLEERQRRETELQQTTQKMRMLLTQSGIINEEEEITVEHVSLFKEGLKKQKLLAQEMQSKVGKKEDLAKDLQAWKSERDSMNDKVKEILAKGNAETFEQFEEACAKNLELKSSLQRLENLREQRSILIGDQGEKQLLEKKQNLEKSLEQMEEIPEIDDTDAAREKLLAEDVPKKEQEVSDLQRQIAAEEARLQERWESEHSLAEIEEQLQEAQAHLNRLELYREAVSEAKELIQESATEFHERVFAPEMSACCGDLVKSATGGRYNEILLEKDLSMVRVRGAETQLFQAPWLSRGAVEQVYFALRVGIGQFLSRGREPLPLILDDTFANTDDRRLPEVCRLLMGIAETSQILLLTCHRRQVETLEQIAQEKGVSMDREQVGPFDFYHSGSAGNPSS